MLCLIEGVTVCPVRKISELATNACVSGAGAWMLYTLPTRLKNQDPCFFLDWIIEMDLFDGSVEG